MTSAGCVRVWAPRAKRAEIVVGDRRIPAVEEGGGWWRGPVLAHGDDYAISLDGGPARPDPRSRWQPEGVHGVSRWVDPTRLATPRPRSFTPVPLRDAVIYELHVGTFSEGGTFVSAIPHLDHLVELGATHVEIMPVAQFSGHHGWGYDGVDLFAAHAAYGGPDGLRQLVEACHGKGLAVLLDVVHNHLGPEGAYLPEFAPYKTDLHKTPWGEAINLDGPDAREVRRFLIDSALAWVRDYDIDGLRLDALHSLVDGSDRHFVAELTDEIHALAKVQGRPIVLIGEYDDHDPASVTETTKGGWGLDAHWNDDFHHALHALLTGETTSYYVDFAGKDALAKVLTKGYALDGGHSPFRGKPHGKPYADLPRERLVAYVQSHDQVGNRGRGERLHDLAGLPKAKIAAAILLVSPFVPMLFQGEEWAASTPFLYFADLQSEELRTAVREGRRAEHAHEGEVPDPTDMKTRDASVLRWAERTTPPHAEMLAWYRDLIALRRAYPELRDGAAGSTQVETVPGGFRIVRGRMSLVVNLSEAPVAVGDGEIVLASSPVTGGRLPAVSCAIVRR